MEEERKEGMKFQLFANHSLVPSSPSPKRFQGFLLFLTHKMKLFPNMALVPFPWLSPRPAGTCQSGSFQEGLQCAHESMKSAWR